MVSGGSTGPVPVSGELPAKSGVVRLPIEAVQRDSTQPRKVFDEAKLQELAESIKAQGVIQPIVVRELAAGADSKAMFEIVAGERRWRASQEAGLTEVPVVVRDLDDRTVIAMALIERGPERMGQTVHVSNKGGDPIPARIVDPVLYDKAGEKLNA